MYKLSKSLEGHSSDVRTLTSSPDGVLYSGSRDRTVMKWTDYFGSLLATLPKYISSLAISEEGHLMVGCNDGLIRVFEGGFEPTRVFKGHQQTVSSLCSTRVGTLLSGSWDTTIRVWSGDKCTGVLEGHTAAIWSVAWFPRSGIIVSGSADKTIKLWKGGDLYKTLEGHTDCVRAVLVMPDKDELLSASNDSSVRRWNLEGECLSVFHGHEHYIYSLALGKSFDFASCGEDRTVRLWKDGQIDQTLQIPAQSVWCVNVLNNGDVAAGSSDGKIWIFSADSERQASVEIQKLYEEEVSSQKIANQTHVGDIKMSDIPGPESLLQPGSRDGQTKMVRTGTKVTVHSWSAAEGKWSKIGDLVGAPEPSKTTFEGKTYDFVFDVDLDDPPRIIKLPYNKNQDPWIVAQDFINKNELPQVYLEDIAKFIIKNSKAGGAGDATRSLDPFTGASAYHSSSETTSERSFSGDPLTGSSAYTSYGLPVNPYFPQREFLQFNAPPKIDPMLRKLKEFNDIATPAHKLSEEELWKLPNFISENTCSRDDIAVLIKILKWPLNMVFPGLDLLRLAVIKPASGELLCAPKVIDTVLSVLLTNIESESPPNNRMLALRAMANLFNDTEGLKTLLKTRESVVTRLISVFPTENKNVEIALSTVMLNFSIALVDDEEGQVQVLSGLVMMFLDGVADPEAKFRALVALGTLISYSKSNIDYVITMDARNKLMDLKSSESVEKVVLCANHILSHL